jgi:catechol 2,3-dioxygenase-like lactoylglutathione lyase family enzyme
VNNLYARAVFFVRDAERSLRYYVDDLGFSEDWNFKYEGRTDVCQVSLFGFEVILNQVWEQGNNVHKAGHGRVYIGLEDDQIGPFRKHVAEKRIKTERVEWGKPTLVIKDPDGNELYFWDWPDKQAGVTQGPASQ